MHLSRLLKKFSESVYSTYGSPEWASFRIFSGKYNNPELRETPTGRIENSNKIKGGSENQKTILCLIRKTKIIFFENSFEC